MMDRRNVCETERACSTCWSRNWGKYGHFFAALAFLALPSLSCMEMGVQGSATAVSPKFTGISAATPISPTTVAVSWAPVAGYQSYTIYCSNSDSPIATLSVGSSFNVTGLSPNTTYSFSVVGSDGGGNQIGIGAQLRATTLSNFLGPSAASAVDAQSVKLDWSYPAGPTFYIYASTGQAPAITSGNPPTLNSPQYTTSSSSGYTVQGLQPQTTYYFMVVAKYQDGTTSWALTQAGSNISTANYISTGDPTGGTGDPATPGGLITLPVITTQANISNSLPPIFSVSNSIGTYTQTFKYGSTILGSVVGSGTVTATLPLPSGIDTVTVTISDALTGISAYAALRINVSANPTNDGLKIVNATTPTNLTPLPTITINGVAYTISGRTPNATSISLGPYPLFTVTNAQIGYVTTIYNGGMALGSVTGNGSVKTLSSAPLQRGINTLRARVTYANSAAEIDNIQVYVKNIDPVPVNPPTSINNGVGEQGVGYSMAVGDFNCDGYPDLAIGAPWGQGAAPKANQINSFNGGVYVYYGSATGLDTSATPSPSPTGKQPLFIPDPANGAPWGDNFGLRLAAGNINGAVNMGNGKPCSDLIVGAPQQNGMSGWGGPYQGGFYAYYGAPSGLQTGTPLVMGFSCEGGGSTACTPGAFFLNASETKPYSTFSNFGSTIAVGDINGDGYDDVVASASAYWDQTGFPFVCDLVIPCPSTGAIFVYWGSPNGLASNYMKILAPTSLDGQTTMFGQEVAVGYFGHRKSDDPRAEIMVGMNAEWAAGPIKQNAGAIIYLPNTSATAGRIENTVVGGYPTTFVTIQPPQCNPNAPTDGVQSAGCGQRIVVSDFNADGYDDIAFSGPWARTSQGAGAGAVIAYYGSAAGIQGNLTTPSSGAYCFGGGCAPQIFYRSTDGTPNMGFGFLGAVGDTNGDGFPDLAIGAPGWATSSGLLYLYHGSAAGLTANPATTFSASAPIYSFFGNSAVGANFQSASGMQSLFGGTSHNDLIVGAIGQAPAHSKGHGQAHVFTNPGGSGFATSNTAVTKTLAPTNQKLVAMNADNSVIVGDINGDGFADVAVGITIPGAVTVAGGTAFSPNWQYGFVVYYGSVLGLVTSPAPSLTPVNPGEPLLVTAASLDSSSPSGFPIGSHILKAGDTNADGYNDIVVGDGYSLVLFYGQSSGLVAGTIPNVSPLSQYDPRILTQGASVGVGPRAWERYLPYQYASGDFNGDGYSDIAVEWSGSALAGAVGNVALTVIYGSPNGPIAGGSIWDPTNGNFASALPENQAGLIPRCDTTTSPPTCYPVLLYTAHNDNVIGVPWNYSGWSTLVNAGDTDGDGTDDLVVTSFMATSWYSGAGTQKNDGGAYLYFGSKTAGLDPLVYVQILPEPAVHPHTGTPRRLGDSAGGGNGGDAYNMLGGFDFNGDGLADFVLTSRNENKSGGSAPGSVYVIHGVAGYGVSPDQTSGPYIRQGVCPSFPCQLQITASLTGPNGNPAQLVDSVDNSCNAIGCNVLRFWPVATTSGTVTGAVPLGDITGDAFSELAVSLSLNNSSKGAAGDGQVVIYSGSATGLHVTGAPKANPSCIGGVCDPFIVEPPQGGLWRSSYNQNMSISGFSNAGDIDGDGKNDFLLRGHYMNDPLGNGFWVGGFFLFH